MTRSMAMAEAPDPREAVRRLAGESLERGDATGWFERLYASAGTDTRRIPWADLRPNPLLVGWTALPAHCHGDTRAIVVGCGFGDDAEDLAARGAQVVAFDIAATAIARCRGRFPASAVEYRVADLLAPPPEWRGAFTLVLESYTLQALPEGPVRNGARRSIASFVAPGGALLVIGRGREPDDDPGRLPWPLTYAEIESLCEHGLTLAAFDDLHDDDEARTRRFRALLTRAAR